MKVAAISLERFKMALHIGSVDIGMTTTCPATAADVSFMRTSTDSILSVRGIQSRHVHHACIGDLLLEVAFQAEVGIAFREHFLIHCAVRVMTGRATLAHRIMREHKGTALLGVTLETSLVFPGELGSTTLDGPTLVRIVAVTAAHLAGKHRMTIGQHELGLFIEVALEAGIRGFFRVDDGTCAAASLDVFAARAVTGFAAHIDGVFPLGLELRVIGRAEVTDELFMAGRTFLGAHEGGTRNGVGRGHHRATRGAAGNQNQGQRGTRTRAPQ